MSTSSNRIPKRRSSSMGRDERERKWGSVSVSARVRVYVSVYVFVCARVVYATM